MTIELARYLDQLTAWPTRGKHILAQFDDDAIIVYQAYKPSIADWALANQRLGGPGFSFSRMSWIKPNFLWMMFRCGWATKVDQERVLAIRLFRSAFDRYLTLGVSSTYDDHRYSDRDEWKRAGKFADVRIQWDPDHDPQGAPVERRAIQIGLRGEALARFGRADITIIEDATELGASMREIARDRNRWAELRTPHERVYRSA